jgi:hypothetical protein
VSDFYRFRPSQLPVVQGRGARRAGPLAIIGTACAIGVVVIIVLYGMTHGPTQQQAASAPTPATAGSTTGQGGAGQSTGAANRGQQTQTPQGAPAPGDSGSATAGGPSARPAPQSSEKQPPTGPAH